MLKLWSLLTQSDYIENLKSQIEIERKEKLELQQVLHKVLKLHLIPKDRTELTDIERPQIPIQNKVRSTRAFLTELQKKSYDEALRQEIEAEERRINELDKESKSEKVKK